MWGILKKGKRKVFSKRYHRFSSEEQEEAMTPFQYLLLGFFKPLEFILSAADILSGLFRPFHERVAYEGMVAEFHAQRGDGVRKEQAVYFEQNVQAVLERFGFVISEHRPDVRITGTLIRQVQNGKHAFTRIIFCFCVYNACDGTERNSSLEGVYQGVVHVPVRTLLEKMAERLPLFVCKGEGNLDDVSVLFARQCSRGKHHHVVATGNRGAG